MFESKFDLNTIEPVNPDFAKVKIYIMYAGKNRNKTYFDKETIEKMIPTLYNIPIVGEFKVDKNDFGGHGGKVVISDDGVEWIETTKPYGVVPSDTEVTWETVTEPDGAQHEYLTCWGYLWVGRYPELRTVLENGAGQSMEISVNSYEEMDDGYIKITDAYFSALCILGKDYEPCFESASIKSFALSQDDFKTGFELILQKLQEIKRNANFISKDEIGTGDPIEIDNSKDSANMTGSWGNVDKTELRNKILKASNYKSLVKECYLIVEDGWEDAPSEHLKYPHHEVRDGKLIVHKDGCQTALAYLHKNGITSGNAIEHLKRHYRELGLDMDSFSQDNVANDNYVLTVKQLEQALRNELSTVKVVDEWGYEVERYWYLDHDEQLVYAQDILDGWQIYGFKYMVNGDAVSIDFASGRKFKIAYVPIEGEEVNNLPLVNVGYFKNVINNITVRIAEEYVKKVNEINARYDELYKEYQQLKEYKAKKEHEEYMLRFEATCSQFADKLDNLEELKAELVGKPIEEVKKILLMKYGEKMLYANMTKQNKKDGNVVDIPINQPINQHKVAKPYVKIIEKYIRK